MLITPLLPVALYARVSTDRQVEAQSVESQAQALRERIAQDVPGILQRSDGLLEFIDEGYSGSTLVRPGLERLRDLAATGGVERVYVHSPDRLARKYAHQALLLEEFRHAGVQVVFLNRDIQQTPGRHQRMSSLCKCKESLRNMSGPKSSSARVEDADMPLNRGR